MADGKHKHTPLQVLKAALGVLALLAFFNLCWLLPAGAGIAWIGHPARGIAWFAFNAAVFSAGLVLAGATIGLLSRLFRKRQFDFFEEILEAIRRISRGDFSARIERREARRGGPFADVVDRFNEMAASLAEMEELRKEFVADASHEIQSPLTSIRGFALALRDPGLPREKSGHYLDVIIAESERLSRLASSLLSLNALEGRSIMPEPTRLDRQLREQILAAEPLWRAKGLSVELDAAELAVPADPLLMSQVWTNLLSNAVKFTPSGGSLRVSLRPEEGAAVARFADSGIGMSEEECLRAFERFYKADASRNSATEGSGLGLAIARKILELHGGSIEASSAGPGKGSLFTVRLPLALVLRAFA